MCNMPCLPRCPLERLHDTKRLRMEPTAISLKHEYSNSSAPGMSLIEDRSALRFCIDTEIESNQNPDLLMQM